MPRATERAMLGCFPVAGRRPALLPSYEEGGSSSSMSASTASPPPTSSSTASTSSPAFLDDDDALYHPDGVDAEPEPDAGGLSTAIATRRFFLATPGLSNSIVDSSVEHHPAAGPAARAPSHGVPDSAASDNVRALRRAATSAFPPRASAAAAASSSSSSSSPVSSSSSASTTRARKVSVSTDAPRADFLKSMVEMVEALGLDPRRRDADLARLHDLLLCYIALNERDALRDILGAFADLMSLLDVTPAAAAVVDDGGEKRGSADEQAGAGR